MGNYKIKDLENLTGIKAHTLRIWEKRYNILSPERSDTKIRLYTDEDLVYLLNLSLLNKKGLKISILAEMSAIEIQNRIKQLEIKDAGTCFHENLLSSLIQMDEFIFKETIQSLIDDVGFESTFQDHVFPFLQRIGVMWTIGTISPAQEHFISNLIRQKTIVEIDKLPNPTSNVKALLFLPEHESHELSLLYYDYFLKKNNIKTYYLGQNLPVDSFLDSYERIQPDFVISSWITHVDESFCLSYMKKIVEESSCKFYVGGHFISQQRKKLEHLIHIIDSKEDLELLLKSNAN